MTVDNPSQATGRIDARVNGIRESSLASRREFLKRSAAAGAGTLALSVAASNTAQADDVNVDDGTDIEVLQFALTLEHLENAFYRDVGGRFDEEDYQRSKHLRGFGDRIRGNVVENFQAIGAHEQTHVDFLTEVIDTQFSDDPVEEACYDFGVDDVDEFLEIARLLENTGVTAYDGSLADIDTAAYASAGATIGTVEARHASYLNHLTGESPFPAAFDTANDRDTVLSAAGGFIVPCE